ncbi:hypothetical protein D3C73_1028440 [compost metagenome]
MIEDSGLLKLLFAGLDFLVEFVKYALSLIYFAQCFANEGYAFLGGHFIVWDQHSGCNLVEGFIRFLRRDDDQIRIQ